MAEIESEGRLIHNIQEFRKTYMPKEIREIETPVGSNEKEFGVNLAKKIMSRIDIKT